MIDRGLLKTAQAAGMHGILDLSHFKRRVQAMVEAIGVVPMGGVVMPARRLLTPMGYLSGASLVIVVIPPVHEGEVCGVEHLESHDSHDL